MSKAGLEVIRHSCGCGHSRRYGSFVRPRTSGPSDRSATPSCSRSSPRICPILYFRPEEWFYTRFLLPAIPVMLVLSTIVVFDLARRVAPVYGSWAAVVVILAVAAVFAATDRSRSEPLPCAPGSGSIPAVGEFVRDRLPDSAFVMAMQHSGSIRYYSGRHTLRWDLLDRASLARRCRRCGPPASRRLPSSIARKTTSSASDSARPRVKPSTGWSSRAASARPQIYAFQ